MAILRTVLYVLVGLIILYLYSRIGNYSLFGSEDLPPQDRCKKCTRCEDCGEHCLIYNCTNCEQFVNVTTPCAIAIVILIVAILFALMLLLGSIVIVGVVIAVGPIVLMATLEKLYPVLQSFGAVVTILADVAYAIAVALMSIFCNYLGSQTGMDMRCASQIRCG